MPPTIRSRFKASVRRGRHFERRECAYWQGLDSGISAVEASTTFAGHRGRIDIRVDEQGGYVSVVELKATNWDRIAPHRVRPTAVRHARQVWRYTKGELARGTDVCAGVIYERAPGESAVRMLVEEILNDRLIQVVWRKDSHRGLQPNRRLHLSAAAPE